MARLASGRNGSELLRVERAEGKHKRLLSFMSKGPVLEKIGAHVDGVWMAGKWRLKGKRNIGTEMIRDVKAQFEGAGWRVVFYGSRKFQRQSHKRILVRSNLTRRSRTS